MEPDGRFTYDRKKDSWLADDDSFSVNIAEGEYCAIDVETTGFNEQTDRITEIAVIKIKKGEVSEYLQFLVNPSRPIPPKIRTLTGITDEMLIDKPPFAQIAPIVQEFIGSSLIIAHHSAFDMRFINAELIRAEYPPLQNTTLCTCQIAKRLFPRYGRYSLDAIAEMFELKFAARHRAFDDALMASHIFIKYMPYFKEHSLNSLRDLLYFIEAR